MYFFKSSLSSISVNFILFSNAYFHTKKKSTFSILYAAMPCKKDIFEVIIHVERTNRQFLGLSCRLAAATEIITYNYSNYSLDYSTAVLTNMRRTLFDI